MRLALSVHAVAHHSYISNVPHRLPLVGFIRAIDAYPLFRGL